jgi:hypothetical protein
MSAQRLIDVFIQTRWYIDPGSGSLFLQMLLAGAAGLFFTLGKPWRWIKSRFGRRKKIPPVE